MAARRLSIKDLATQLNVSASTVSRALAGLPNVSQATQQRVRELAGTLNFQPNSLAAGLRRGSTGVIGVIVPRLTGHFFPEVLHSIAAAASQAGLRVIICESNEDEQQEQAQLLWLLTVQVDGLLISVANAAGSTRHFDVTRQQGVPLVFFNQAIDCWRASSVVFNNCQGAYKGVGHLIAQGRTRVALFTGAQHHAVSREQRRGYAEALQEHGLFLDERLVCAGGPTLAAGRQHMLALLAGPVVPNAIFATQELVAIGAMQVLKEHGLRIPQDVALAAFTTESLAALAEPALTSLDQQGSAMGQAAVQLLLKLLADTKQVIASQCLVLNPTLLVRASSVGAVAGCGTPARPRAKPSAPAGRHKEVARMLA
ncbi:LacI family DNA-binding transcriptional regulator [Hymenobacter coccineus]|uniref:HTH lacI-type domain-containing protein n=1 Tax=Hymenobacter coccineus TaxID=1908235 RepID=A0A1G1SU05_9BACT|nr:LacI family DNA-binding transcriptional regulator [Hymenobacter coccineus]OGX82099.1 hypothetical protein BEN49_02810 [Hymenobacter coccineus]